MPPDDRPLAVALVDGEHYPPVVRAALEHLGGRYRFAAALFLGGHEKLRLPAGATLDEEYGLPVVVAGERPEGTAGGAEDAAGEGAGRPPAAAARGGSPAAAGGAEGPGADRLAPGADLPALAPGNEQLAAVMRLIRQTGATVVVDLSDEPVVGYRERFRLASAALAAGASYAGADFELVPQPLVTVGMPSVSVIGTGKRVGKTAVAGRLARDLRAAAGPGARDDDVVIVAMGRGGPPEPEVVHGAAGIGAAELLEASRRGRHAASDHYEDAALAGVTTVGSRRCGGGLAGTPADSNISAALALLRRLAPRIVLLEGSGSVIPPVRADATVCVAAATLPLDHLAGYLGTLRLLMSDLVLLTLCERPFATEGHVRAMKDEVARLRPDLPAVATVFRPRPLGEVRGRRVAYFSTAAEQALPLLSEHLEAVHGARVVLASGDLASRPRLAAAVRAAAATADVWVTEIKAAAIDVVAEAAAASGRELVFCDNEAVAVDGDDLSAHLAALTALARRRFAARAGA